MRRVTRSLRLLLTLVGAVFIVLVVASLVLARTAPGRDLVLRQVLDRARRGISGDLTVTSITSSRGLFSGFTLHGVELRGADGGTVASADSAWVGYDLISLLTTRTLALRAYNPELTLQRLADGRWNMIAALASPNRAVPIITGSSWDSLHVNLDSLPASLDSLPAEFQELASGVVDLEDVRIVNGLVRIEQRDGDFLVFDAIEAVVPELALNLAAAADRAEISFLSMRGHFEDGLLDVRSLRGELLREGSVLDLEASRIELAESQGQGTARVDWSSPGATEIALALDVRELNLADLQWLNGEIPAGTGSGAIEAQFRPGIESHWRFSGLAVSSGSSRLEGSGGLAVQSGTATFESVDARVDALDLSLLRPWLQQGDSLPPWLDVEITGPVRLSGPFADLSVAATLDVLPAIWDSSVGLELQGGLRLGRNPGARDLRVVARQLDLGQLLRREGARSGLTGMVNLDARLNGRIEDGIEVTGDLLRLDASGPSLLRIDGTVAHTEIGWPVAGLVLLEPLRAVHVRTLAPAAELRGTARGSARVMGKLSDLTIATDLQTSGGPLALQVRLNAFDPSGGIRVAGPLNGVELAELTGRVPDPTTLRGSMNADLLLNPVPRGRIEVDLVDSQLGALRVHRTVFGGVASRGIFEIDSLDVRTSAADFRGTGTVALVDSLPPGEVVLRVVSGSLEGLGPLLFGDSILVADDLTDFDREFLDLSGIDADTLPTSEQVRVAGSAEGTFRVLGHLDVWTATGTIDLADAVYGKYEADTASLELTSFEWPSRAFSLTARTGETRVWERAYRSGEFDLDYDAGSGQFAGALVRSPEEDIRVRAGFVLDDSTTTINLDQATIRSAGERWNLGGPASASWGSNGLSVSDFRLVRPEDGGLRLSIGGTLPRSGDGDLRVSALQVDLGRVARLLQVEDEERVGGTMDLRLRLRGSPAVPLINGTVEASNVTFRSVTFQNIEGDIQYEDQQLGGNLLASIDEGLALSLRGTIPTALSISPSIEARFVDAPINASIDADSVPLDAILGFFDGYENVTGTVTGTVDITGRPDNLQPDGMLVIDGGAADVTFFGIRPRAFNGSLKLSPDGQVAVDATFRERGTGRIAGIIDLNPVTDPRFDLDITANRLRALSRRDIEGVITGSAHLGGSFTRPIIRGALTADEGTLFIDEVVRSAEVFDLTDPTLDLNLAFDTTFGDPLREQEDVNPFLQNLIASVSLTMVRNTWLRSERLNQAMNVELAGTLDMSFDRGQRTLAMLGELTAVRGTYTTLGRNFTVEEGTVRFVGTPGVNPDLDFTADFRVRRDEGPLDITANVGGTLIQPSLRLSSDDQALSESDLYSYVVFGQPTHALSSAQSEIVGQAANLALGSVANQIGNLFSGDLPIDYIDISTSQYFDAGRASGGSSLRREWESTGITLGQYISDDVFLGVRLRPFGSDGATNRFSGRLEWRFRDEWALEAFAEDRSLGNSFVSLDDLGFDLSKVWGFFVFREWGY